MHKFLNRGVNYADQGLLLMDKGNIHGKIHHAY